MAGRDENTYGFRKDDADALIGIIGMGETETPGRRLGGGGGSSAVLYAFTLTEAITDGEAAAIILELDGVDATNSFNDVVYDPMNIFDTLIENSSGLCIKQGGKYYIIQAKCPGTEEEEGPPMGCCSGSEIDPPFQSTEEECNNVELTWTPGDCP